MCTRTQARAWTHRAQKINVDYVSGSWTGQLVPEFSLDRDLALSRTFDLLKLHWRTVSCRRDMLTALFGLASQTLALPSSDPLTPYFSHVEEVTSGIGDYFFNDRSACCSSECDPTNVNSIIYSLPGLMVSLAVDGKKLQQMTVTIPVEYIWRPLVISVGQGELVCRVFGISEGAFTLLGNVFMDGLLTVHNWENKRVGLAAPDNCPNDVTSNKIITVVTVVPTRTSVTLLAPRTGGGPCLAATYRSQVSLVTFGSGGCTLSLWLWLLLS
ncbi:unnamed protein product [Peronospora destructor]|uniref:Peptidase A1 domain-containing protein n=1 Tax=Peronospora destructor TaxID=86335 RepID=A0AAV0V2R3_9STRA|nr:unnamed protein product [Peronospora destructor]